MKKLTITALLSVSVLYTNAQGAMVVTDPTSFAQRLSLATEEMNEQIEQKYKFIEQIKIAQKAYEESKKIQARVEQVSNYIKTANEVVNIIALGEDIMNLCKAMREQLSSSEILSKDEKYQCIVDLINCSSNVSNIARKASAVIQDKTKDNDLSLSDFERQQELRYLRNELELTKADLLRIYNGAYTCKMVERRDNAIKSFINF